MVNWSPWIRKGDPHFMFCRTTCRGDLRQYFCAFDLLIRNGELLLDFPIGRRGELLAKELAVPEDSLRLSPIVQAPTGQILEAV